eukprot:c38441_g1_i1 orf=21-248(+)
MLLSVCTVLIYLPSSVSMFPFSCSYHLTEVDCNHKTRQAMAESKLITCGRGKGECVGAMIIQEMIVLLQDVSQDG